MILKTNLYKLDSKSENVLIENKEAVNNLLIDSPDIIEDVGVKKLLTSDKEEQQKKLL
jgi:hypothetical protein